MKVRRLILFLFILTLTFSCGVEEIGERQKGNGGDIWTGPGMNVGSGDSTKTVSYITAFDYPDDYDWRADPRKGSVKCSLVVFADGIPMMKIPVGDEYEVSSDSDMHRMLSGHLYTDFSTDTETVVRKDGRELFRFPGREMIVGMMIHEGNLYTLGQPRSGTGFTFRKDGEIVLEHSQGRTFGQVYEDGGDVCFAFSEQVNSSDKVYERYYHVKNGTVSQVALREDVKIVWDIMSVEGEICYLASVVGIAEPVLFRGDAMSALRMSPSSTMVTCRFVPAAGKLYVEGVYSSEGQPYASGIWIEGEQYHLFLPGRTVSSICVAEGGVSCAINSNYAGSPGLIFRSGETFAMPDGYMAMGCRSVRTIDGILNVGLSSVNGERPVVWKDGNVETLKINGYISSVTTNKD